MRKQLAVLFTIAYLAIVVFLFFGCSRTVFPVKPPAVSVMVNATPEAGGISFGQGVLVGDRLLTCSHLFDDFIQPDSMLVGDQDNTEITATKFPPREIYVNSQSRLVLGSPYHGNFNARAVDRTSMHIDEQALLMREDWAAFALAPNMSEQSSSSLVGWDIDDCQVKPGDRLYMFRQDPILPEMRIVPMTAIIPHYKDSNNNVKYYSQVDGVVQAVVPSDAKLLRSYSGGFVGKYIEELQCWEFVGISVGAQPAKARNMTILFIVRPPQEVLEWLAGGNVERTQSDPPATDAKSIER